MVSGTCDECQLHCKLLHGKKDPSSTVTSFFKIMFSQFEERVLMPRAFAKSIVSLGGTWTWLEDAKGQRWRVKISLSSNNCLSFEQGWSQFASDHSIELRDFVTFHYIVGSHFVAHIYQQAGNEKLYFDKKSSLEQSEKDETTLPNQPTSHVASSRTGRQKRRESFPCSKPAVSVKERNECGKDQAIFANSHTSVAGSSGNAKDIKRESDPSVYLATPPEGRKECRSKLNPVNKSHDDSSTTKFPEYQDNGKGEWQPENVRLEQGGKLNSVIGNEDNFKVDLGKTHKSVVENHEVKVAVNHGNLNPLKQDKEEFSTRKRPVAGEEKDLWEQVKVEKGKKKISIDGNHEDSRPSKLAKYEVMELSGKKLRFAMDNQGEELKLKQGSEGKRSRSNKENHTEEVKAKHGFKSVVVKIEPEDEAFPRMGDRDYDLSATEDDTPTVVPSVQFCSAVLVLDPSFLELPKELPYLMRRGYWKRERRIVFLRDPSKKIWPVFYYERPGFNVLTSGWEYFVRTNRIQLGDTCFIEVEDIIEGLFRVQISRKQG